MTARDVFFVCCFVVIYVGTWLEGYRAGRGERR